MRARAAAGDERSRPWAGWREIDKNLDTYAALRSTETTVVVFEQRLDGEASWARRWGMTLGAASKTHLQNAPEGASR